MQMSHKPPQHITKGTTKDERYFLKRFSDKVTLVQKRYTTQVSIFNILVIHVVAPSNCRTMVA